VSNDSRNNEGQKNGEASNPLECFVMQYGLFLDQSREELKEPWSEDGYTFCSDGHILLRLPAIAGILRPPPFDRKMPWPDAALLPEMTKAKRVKVGTEKCSFCKGSGEVLTCPDCEGLGIVSWDVGKHEYEHDCYECDGTGFINSGDGDKCEECDGTGRIIKVEAAHVSGCEGISNVKMNKLATLPGCMFSRETIFDDVFYFRFEGGDGLVMAIRV